MLNFKTSKVVYCYFAWGFLIFLQSSLVLTLGFVFQCNESKFGTDITVERAIGIFKDLNKVKQASYFGRELSLLAFRALRDEIVQWKNTILLVVVWQNNGLHALRNWGQRSTFARQWHRGKHFGAHFHFGLCFPFLVDPSTAGIAIKNDLPTLGKRSTNCAAHAKQDKTVICKIVSNRFSAFNKGSSFSYLLLLKRRPGVFFFVLRKWELALRFRGSSFSYHPKFNCPVACKLRPRCWTFWFSRHQQITDISFSLYTHYWLFSQMRSRAKEMYTSVFVVYSL